MKELYEYDVKCPPLRARVLDFCKQNMGRRSKYYLRNAQGILTRILAFTGLFPTWQTGKAEIEGLLRRIHPVKVDLVRLGPNADGGYLVPNKFEGVEACFSPGIDSVSVFETKCAEMGMKVYLADRSVDSPAAQHSAFVFTKKYLGAYSDNNYMTIEEWVDSAGVAEQSDLILQIDIEGFEYEVFMSMSNRLLSRFRIIVAEFHQMDQLWNRPFYKVVSRVFEKILQSHACVHAHPNNRSGSLRMKGIEIPRLMELTFLRNDYLPDELTYRDQFPHELDCDNSENPTIKLPPAWYRSAGKTDKTRSDT